MAVLSSLIVRIGADTGGLAKGFQTAAGAVQSGAAKIGAAAATAVAWIGPALVAAASAGGLAAIKLAGDMEQSRIAFTTLLGDGKKADAFLKQLAEFAAKTPFNFPELQDAARKMLAFGFSAEQVIPMLTSVGDAVAALGGSSEIVNRVTLALGQMQAKGKVSGEEMRQLAETGIPVWQMLADKIGITIPEAMKAAEKGAISSADGIGAILEGLNAKYVGSMEKQSTTLVGLWSTAKDNITLSLSALGAQIIQTFDLKDTLSGAIKWLDNLRAALEKGGIREAFENLFPPEVFAGFERIYNAIRDRIIPELKNLATEIGSSLGLITGDSSLIGNVVQGLGWVAEKVGDVVHFFRLVHEMVVLGVAGFYQLKAVTAEWAVYAMRNVYDVADAFSKLPFVNAAARALIVDGLETLKQKMMDAAVESLNARDKAAEWATQAEKIRQELEGTGKAAVEAGNSMSVVLPFKAKEGAASVIEITRSTGEQIKDHLKGGLGRGVEEGISAGEAALQEWRAKIAASPINVKLQIDMAEFARQLALLQSGKLPATGGYVG